MREMNLSEVTRRQDNLKRMQIIQTRSSQKIRPEDEIIILMKSTRNRFKKSVESGKIEIISEREWSLH